MTLESIPVAVWAAIVGSLGIGSLVGAVVTNWSQTRRLRVQLSHDVDEKAKDRTATLRREVYLKAAEEFSRASGFFSSMSAANIVNPETNGLMGFSAAAAKLQLVAEASTALLVNELAMAYAELYLQLMVPLIPLEEARNDIKNCDDLYNEARVDVRRVLTQIAAIRESPEQNEPLQTALSRAFDIYQAHATKYASERDAAWGRYNRANLEFQRQVLDGLRSIGDLPTRAMVEARRDLGLAGDLELFRAQSEQMWERTMESRRGTIRLLEDLINGDQTAC